MMKKTLISLSPRVINDFDETKKHGGLKIMKKTNYSESSLAAFFVTITTLTTFFQKGLLKSVKIYKINQEATNNPRNFTKPKAKNLTIDFKNPRKSPAEIKTRKELTIDFFY